MKILKRHIELSIDNEVFKDVIKNTTKFNR